MRTCVRGSLRCTFSQTDISCPHSQSCLKTESCLTCFFPLLPFLSFNEQTEQAPACVCVRRVKEEINRFSQEGACCATSVNQRRERDAKERKSWKIAVKQREAASAGLENEFANHATHTRAQQTCPRFHFFLPAFSPSLSHDSRLLYACPTTTVDGGHVSLSRRP